MWVTTISSRYSGTTCQRSCFKTLTEYHELSCKPWWQGQKEPRVWLWTVKPPVDIRSFRGYAIWRLLGKSSTWPFCSCLSTYSLSSPLFSFEPFWALGTLNCVSVKLHYQQKISNSFLSFISSNVIQFNFLNKRVKEKQSSVLFGQLPCNTHSFSFNEPTTLTPERLKAHNSHHFPFCRSISVNRNMKLTHLSQ